MKNQHSTTVTKEATETAARQNGDRGPERADATSLDRRGSKTDAAGVAGGVGGVRASETKRAADESLSRGGQPIAAMPPVKQGRRRAAIPLLILVTAAVTLAWYYLIRAPQPQAGVIEVSGRVEGDD